MKDILNTYTTTELKKLISQYNKSLGDVRGYSKLKKGQLIQLMTKAENVDKFKNIKAKVPKETVKKAVKKVETKQPPIKKVEPPKPAPKPVKKVEPPKPAPKPVKKVEPPKTTTSPTLKTSIKNDITLKALINEFDTPSRDTIFFQYDMDAYRNLEKFISKRKGKIDVDQLVSTGLFFKKELVRGLVFKYGLKLTLEYIKELLENIDDEKEYFIPEEAIKIRSIGSVKFIKSKIIKEMFKRDSKDVKI
jgi:hypothetical protein